MWSSSPRSRSTSSWRLFGEDVNKRPWTKDIQQKTKALQPKTSSPNHRHYLVDPLIQKTFIFLLTSRGDCSGKMSFVEGLFWYTYVFFDINTSFFVGLFSQMCGYGGPYPARSSSRRVRVWNLIYLLCISPLIHATLFCSSYFEVDFDVYRSFLFGLFWHVCVDMCVHHSGTIEFDEFVAIMSGQMSGRDAEQTEAGTAGSSSVAGI